MSINEILLIIGTLGIIGTVLWLTIVLIGICTTILELWKDGKDKHENDIS